MLQMKRYLPVRSCALGVCLAGKMRDDGQILLTQRSQWMLVLVLVLVLVLLLLLHHGQSDVFFSDLDIYSMQIKSQSLGYT